MLEVPHDKGICSHGEGPACKVCRLMLAFSLKERWLVALWCLLSVCKLHEEVPLQDHIHDKVACSILGIDFCNNAGRLDLLAPRMAMILQILGRKVIEVSETRQDDRRQ